MCGDTVKLGEICRVITLTVVYKSAEDVGAVLYTVCGLCMCSVTVKLGEVCRVITLTAVYLIVSCTAAVHDVYRVSRKT